MEYVELLLTSLWKEVLEKICINEFSFQKDHFHKIHGTTMEGMDFFVLFSTAEWTVALLVLYL